MALKLLIPFWPGIRFAAVFSGGAGYLTDVIFNGGEPWFLFRMLAVGLVALAAYEAAARFPRTPPAWLARWALQVLAVAFAVPTTTLMIWMVMSPSGEWRFWQDGDRLMEFGFVTFVGLLLAPWIALGALVRQREAFVSAQAVALDVARSRLERSEQDAKLTLLQAQTTPHFLFNTLANVQALVDAGSPRAPALLRALTSYLRTTISKPGDARSTIERELSSTKAYLELMQMRMPDRLTWLVQAEAAAAQLDCPPLTILTLVENAVRHGIDPSESGGHIDVAVAVREDRCCICVSDTGQGLQSHSTGLGTGLARLRERLKLEYGDAASLHLYDVEPRGVCAEIEIPCMRTPL